MSIFLQPQSIESEEEFFEADAWYSGIPSQEAFSTFTVLQIGLQIVFGPSIPSAEAFSNPWIVEPNKRSYLTFKAAERQYKYQASKKK